jgi:hypothetical protein
MPQGIHPSTVKAVPTLMDQEGRGSLHASKIRPGLLQERSSEYGLFFGSLTLGPVLIVSRKKVQPESAVESVSQSLDKSGWMVIYQRIQGVEVLKQRQHRFGTLQLILVRYMRYF